jgi:hypothetical protein
LVSTGGIEAKRVFLTSSRHVEGSKEEKGSMVKLTLK